MDASASDSTPPMGELTQAADPAAEAIAAAPAPTGEAAPVAAPTAAVVDAVPAPAPVTAPAFVELSAEEVAKLPKPTVGRVVLFALPTKDYQGQQVIETRPAIVTRVWERTDGRMPLVQLAVLKDGGNDRCEDLWPVPKLPSAIDAELASFLTAMASKLAALEKLIAWKTSVIYSGEGAPGTWRWMPFQLGQAAKTDDVAGALRKDVDSLTAAVKAMVNRQADLVEQAAELGAEPTLGGGVDAVASLAVEVARLRELVEAPKPTTTAHVH